MGSERGQSHGVYTYDPLTASYVSQRGLRTFAGTVDPNAAPEDIHDGDFWWDGTEVKIWNETGSTWIALAGGAGAPVGASYVTMAVEGGLTNESVLGPDVIMADVVASRPGAATAGRLFYATDEGIIYRDTSSAWVKVGVHEYAELDNRSHTLSAGDHSGSLPEATVSFDTVAGHDHDGTDSKAFVYGIPTAIGEGDIAADGVATTPARLDHLHGSPSTWTPAAHAASHAGGGGDDIGGEAMTITGNWDVSGITGRIIVQTGAGAPTHSEAEGTVYWDTTNNILYVNDDGATAWTLVGPGGGAAHTLDSATHTDVAAITEQAGDLLVWNGTNWVDLNVGGDGTQLTADSGQTEGVAWAAAGGADPTPHPYLFMGA